MTVRCVLLAVLALLSGCSQIPGRHDTLTAGYYAGNVKGELVCRNAAQCVVWIIPGCSSASASDCGGQLEYDPVSLDRGHGNLTVTWKLPANYKFCPQLGDGVFLKDELTDQFRLDARPPGQDCSDSVQLTAVNSVPRAAPYKYKLLFHDMRDLARQYTVDPSFYNR